jgi:hypothetical protein
MTRQIEAAAESRQARLDKMTVKACNGGLESAVAHAGGLLSGLSIRIDEYEVLVTIKATFPGGPQVAFVGAEDVAGALRKGMREAARDSLNWKADQWAKAGT